MIKINIFDKTVITKITHVLLLDIAKGEKMDVTDRTNCGISVALKGKIIYKHNNKEYLNDINHLIVYPKNQSYSWECTENAKVFVINFCATNEYAPSSFLSVNVANSDVIIEQCKNLRNYFISEIRSNITYCMSLIYKILSLIDYNKMFSIPSVLFKPVSFIENNYTNPSLSVKDISESANISEIYLRKLFKKHYNISPTQYLKSIRIEKAKLLLSGDEKSVEEISSAVGYSSIYVFSRAFKEHEGISPNKYRKDLYSKI